MGINLGATLGQLVTGLLGEKIGFGWGFGVAGVGMLAGLLWYTFLSRRTLGNIGVEPTRLPIRPAQAKREGQTKLFTFLGLGILALVVVLAAAGVITIDPQTVAGWMTAVLVAIAVVYFIYIFAAGGLDSNEKKRVIVIFVLFVAAAIFWAAFEQAPTSLNLFAKDFTDRSFLRIRGPGTLVPVDQFILHYHFRSSICSLVDMARAEEYKSVEPDKIRRRSCDRGRWLPDNDRSGEQSCLHGGADKGLKLVADR